MADISKIKIGSSTYTLKDYGIRPNVTECYKQLFSGDKAHNSQDVVLNAHWPRYHIFGVKVYNIDMMLIGSKFFNINSTATTDNSNQQIHCFGAYDAYTASHLTKASLLRTGSNVNNFAYYGSNHKLDSDMSGNNPRLLEVWGFF